MFPAITYFHENASSQISATALNTPPISMVTKKLYFTGQLTLLTTKFAWAERFTSKKLFYIFKVFLFSLFILNFIFFK